MRAFPNRPVLYTSRMRTSPRILSLAIAVATAITLLVPPGARAGAPAIVRNPADPAYVTHLRTGGKGLVWTGTHSVSFTNLDTAPLSTLYLRTWSNGVLGCGGHSIEVTDMQGGTLVDDEALDCTEIEVDLDAPLAQGARTTLSMDLRIEVPPRNDRFGFHDGLSLLGTALPTLEVHDDLGWHHDPFIDLGESFYSIVGRYRVTLNVPEALDTPTTGLAIETTAPAPGRRETTYTATNVRDFAWAAGQLKRIVGISGETRLVVSYQPGAVSASQARTSLRNAERSLDTFSAEFGTFPYREMDVVLAGFATFGGMEYPTIIFTNPDKITVSHELAHQYWYGIVGDDEFAEPWLDESFATWSSYLPFGTWKNCSVGAAGLQHDITNDMAYWNAHPNGYGTIYSGGGCMLANLAHRFGLTRFVNILEHYAADHWLGVSRTGEFKAAIEAAAAKHLPGFDTDAYWATWRLT
jgi:Peptidase family M1 domain